MKDTKTPGVGRNPAALKALEDVARSVRLDVLDMTSRMGGHPTSCFSAVEILTVLYLGGVLRCRPRNLRGPTGTASS